MDPDHENFIRLATQPLAGNAELHVAAQVGLRETLAEHSREDSAAVAGAIVALARADEHPWRKRWPAAAALAMLVAGIVIGGGSLARLLPACRTLPGMGNLAFLSTGTASSGADPLARQAQHLTPAERLLLLGDSKASTEPNRWRPLWDSQPDNPAFLADYASAYFHNHRELSPEILAAAKRIDPDNGWYSILQAASLSESAIPLNPARHRSGTAGPEDNRQVPVRIIADEARFDTALNHLHEAARCSRWNDHQGDLLRQRIRLLPPRDDFVSQVTRISYLAGQRTSSIWIKNAGNLISVAARRCGERKDREGFQQLVRDWHWLSRTSITNANGLVDLLVARAVICGPLEEFQDAAKELGFDEQARNFAELDARCKAEHEARRLRQKVGYEMASGLDEKQSLLGQLAIPAIGSVVANPPTIGDGDLRPLRYVDHALFGRCLVASMMVVVGLVVGGAALHRFRHGLLVRRLSARMTDLLRPADHAWIVVGGIVVPLLYHVLITRFSPWSAREWSLVRNHLVPSAGQYAATLLLLLVLPVAIARWRIGLRGGFLGLPCRRTGIAWLMAVLAAVCLPLAAAAVPDTKGVKTLTMVSAVLLAVVQFWIVIGAVRALFGRHCHALRRATTGRVLVPAWLSAWLLLACCLLLLGSEENYWIQRDPLFDITPDFPGLTRPEWIVTQLFRAELLELLPPAPPP